MSDPSGDSSWGRRGIAIVAMFVFLNQVFGTETLGGLLDASWSQPLTWAGVVLGLLASAFLVETCRRADWDTPRWFVEVFAIIGMYVVFWDLWSHVLDPALDPLADPVFDAMPAWMVPVLLVIFLAVGVFAISRMIRRDWKGGGSASGG